MTCHYSPYLLRHQNQKALTVLIAIVALSLALLTSNTRRMLAAGVCPGPSFNTSPVFPVGTEPRAIVSGDLNGDGNKDLVVANSLPDADISILLGDGSGRFTPAPRLRNDAIATSSFLALGDFNNDGNLDVVTRSTVVQRIAISYGDGRGGFAQPLTMQSGNNPGAMVVADFNGDNLSDLAVGNQDSNDVAIFIGTGSAGLAPARIVSMASSISPKGLDVGDVNGDHKIDLLAVDSGGGAAELIGDGTGKFSVSYLLNTNQSITDRFKIADFNNDGKADLVSTQVNGVNMTVLLGDGNGAFPTRFVFNNLAPTRIVVGDFNRDGKQDFAISRMPGVAVMLGNGDASFVRQDYVAGSIPVDLVTGDFDNNLTPDLAVVNSKSYDVSVLKGDGAGNFDAARSYSTQAPGAIGGLDPSGIAAADLNGDGHQDIIVTNTNSRNVAVFLGDGKGGLAPAQMYSVAPRLPKSIAIADFNGDGKLDLAVAYSASSSTDTFGILPGRGDGTFSTVVGFPISVQDPYWITAADLNGDGRQDLCLLVANSLVTVVNSGINFNTGSSFQTAHIFQVGPNPSALTVADLNGDGKLDMIVPVPDGLSSPNRPLVWIGFGDGAVGVANSETLTVGNAPRGVTVGDFDGDGKRDLAVTSELGQGGLSTLFGDGVGGFTYRETFVTGSGAHAVTVGDFNGDGKSDLAATGTNWNSVSILLGLGAGSFTHAIDYGTGSDPRYVTAIDLNEDGKSDLAIANRISADLTVMLSVPCVAATPTPTPTPGTIQFTGSLVSVGEGEQRVSLTVTRSGPVSAAASVSYATTDSAGSQVCSVLNGNASSRCDYVASGGSLQFAAGEATKSFSIAVVDDSYAEGDETFSVTLMGPVGSSLGVPSTTTVKIVDNDNVNGANPIDNANFFVRQQYLDFLRREPDVDGLNFWTNQITACGGDQSCVEIKRINVSAAFYLSIEFQETGYLAYRIYKTAYGNVSGAPVPIRLIEFLPGTQEIGKGVIVGQAGWEQVLESNKQNFVTQFVNQQRFLAAYPISMSSAQFVDALNANAGGVLSPDERGKLVDNLASGVLSRSQVLRAVAEDPDLSNAESNRAFVLMQYFGYLCRNPDDAPNSNYDGFNFWLGKLNQFNGNFVSAEMVKAFIVSGEYRLRFGP